MKNRFMIALASAALVTVGHTNAADKWKKSKQAESRPAQQGLGNSKAQEQLEVTKMTAALANVMAKKETDVEAKRKAAELAKKANGVVAQTSAHIQQAEAEAKAKQAALHDPFARFSNQPKMETPSLLGNVKGGTLGVEKAKKPANSSNTGSLKPVRFKMPVRKPAEQPKQAANAQGFSKPSYSLPYVKPAGNGSDSGDILSVLGNDSDSGEGAPRSKETIIIEEPEA